MENEFVLGQTVKIKTGVDYSSYPEWQQPKLYMSYNNPPAYGTIANIKEDSITLLTTAKSGLPLIIDVFQTTQLEG